MIPDKPTLTSWHDFSTDDVLMELRLPMYYMTTVSQWRWRIAWWLVVLAWRQLWQTR